MSIQDFGNELLIHRPQNLTSEEPLFARDAPSQSKVSLMKPSSCLSQAVAHGQSMLSSPDLVRDRLLNMRFSILKPSLVID